ncbi:MAG TPA: ABC transporter permease subunit [Gemmataceae bacterium]|nr:ABC transporter permease subunit [Gemmataceae bacterium]
MGSLVAKLLRDVRWPLLGVLLLLAGFECLWVKITQRIAGQLLPLLMGLASAWPISKSQLENTLFEGPGKIMRTLMGGENINLEKARDMLSVGYVHPLVITILCIWAMGRASGAIAGEIDRGTMELLLAQPVRRSRLILAHLGIDLLTIPLLCLSMWAGTMLGVWLVGPIELSSEDLKRFPFPVQLDPEALRLDPVIFGPGLWNVAALVFAVSGYTLWLSAAGRFRWKVLSAAIFLTLLQFLINVVGQFWDAVGVLRPFTIFYYYQPQQIILAQRWSVDLGNVWNHGHPLWTLNVLGVLVTVGVIGYGMALWTFTRRDLPAPL